MKRNGYDKEKKIGPSRAYFLFVLHNLQSKKHQHSHQLKQCKPHVTNFLEIARNCSAVFRALQNGFQQLEIF